MGSISPRPFLFVPAIILIFSFSAGGCSYTNPAIQAKLDRLTQENADLIKALKDIPNDIRTGKITPAEGLELANKYAVRVKEISAQVQQIADESKVPWYEIAIGLTVNAIILALGGSKALSWKNALLGTARGVVTSIHHVRKSESGNVESVVAEIRKLNNEWINKEAAKLPAFNKRTDGNT